MTRLDTLLATMNVIANLSPAQLRQAADIQERIQSLQTQLSRLLGAPTAAAARPAAKRWISAAGRARIAAAARARWAKARAGKGKAKTASKPTRKLSAKARARLSAIAKARWLKVKASGRSKL